VEDNTGINDQWDDEIINLAYIKMRASIEEFEKKWMSAKNLKKRMFLTPSGFNYYY